MICIWSTSVTLLARINWSAWNSDDLRPEFLQTLTLYIGIPESWILNEIFSVYSPGIKYLHMFIFSHATFFEDETHYGVCPYADQHGNLSFIVCVKVKWVLCYFVMVSRSVAYMEYSKTLKNIMSGGRHLLLLTLNYTVTLPGLVIFSYKAILWCMAMGHKLLTINHFKACLAIT